ncbi:xanthine dehydrogenase family protein molybdopterin-binding subunit [Ramlibacter tataouinensis]|uniref:Xanthine dehydrogenase-like protein n=1 Tax=Ramlibacter tataouinensis (strain ATCC BAA-407 / DSM 14655 / LMG 21543 / TTB310) TaxID=365046 RepID=F5Y2B1_RAMTT|nr:xanthine dehydrogenase family protein molybdopterin-binding subunit [Ramlibacter tataouinensis]AEG91085.1 xanthine dehydrogenase-like protein [Ramlibacter tataouinensis TTB310]
MKVLEASIEARQRDVQPVAEPGTGHVKTGQGTPRVDGRAKVTGGARYAAEHVAPDMLFGVVVCSGVARGRIRQLHLGEALAAPGVVEILWHGNRPRMRKLGLFYKDMTSPSGTPFKPLYDDRVLYSGQPIALVVARTFEEARYASSLVRADYEEEPHETNLLENLHRAREPRRMKAGFSAPPGPTGQADSAFAAAPVQVDMHFHHGVEHHNPLEMHASTVLFEPDGHMVVYDKTQSSINSRSAISRAFGIPARKLTVKNPFVGGAFGSGLRPQYQLYLAVMAALRLEQPVRVVLTRQQMFSFGHRPETWQHVQLAAERDGTLKAIIHECIHETSRFEDYVEVVVNWSGQLYKCDNVRLRYEVVSLDQYTPLDMRAPGAAHGVHALEVAMDELSYALKMDPLALRLKNYTDVDPAGGTPYSTKELRACYEQGARRFGWERRNPQPRSLQEGGELVGWGMATGQWDALQMLARVRAVLHPDGRLVLSSAASDIGTGSYTAFSQLGAEAMGLPMENVAFQLGDSTLPFAPVEGGSSHVATIGSAIVGVCERLQRKLWSIARVMPDSPFRDSARSDEVLLLHGEMRWKRADGQAEPAPAGALPLADLLAWWGRPIEESYFQLPNKLQQRKHVCATHSAVFCEVRVDEEFGTVRVTRVVSAVAAGRIVNETTARSQVMGGVVWGISQALHEETHTDHRLGRFMNHNLSEYHVAINADVQDIDVVFVPEDDRVVSRIGAKGVGEIGIVGVAAAISNAIYHATGRRVRSTPMTPDKVMAPGDGWEAGDAAVGIDPGTGRFRR